MIDQDLLRAWNEWLVYRLAERQADGETLKTSAARCVRGHVEGILAGKRAGHQPIAAVDVALIEARKANAPLEGQ